MRAESAWYLRRAAERETANCARVLAGFGLGWCALWLATWGQLVWQMPLGLAWVRDNIGSVLTLISQIVIMPLALWLLAASLGPFERWRVGRSSDDALFRRRRIAKEERGRWRRKRVRVYWRLGIVGIGLAVFAVLLLDNPVSSGLIFIGVPGLALGVPAAWAGLHWRRGFAAYCARCGYPAGHREGGACPECGRERRGWNVRVGRPVRLPWAIGAGLAGAMFGAAAIVLLFSSAD